MAVPYKKSKQTKKGQVEEMFDNISSRYDLLNHVLSVNIDKIWRKRTIRRLKSFLPENILDVATGTGDFAIAASKLPNARITGIDISAGMLSVGERKIRRLGLEKIINFAKADSEDLPFESCTYDAVTVGFGVRNFENLECGLAEIFRVLRPGGVLMVLEFSKPRKTPVKQLYKLYFTRILPQIGKIVSKDSSAYNYLPESVNEFPDGKKFTAIVEKIGFRNNTIFSQTFGIATLYQCLKPEK